MCKPFEERITSSLSERTKFRVIWRSRACRMVAESPHAAHSGPKQPQLSRNSAEKEPRIAGNGPFDFLSDKLLGARCGIWYWFRL